MNGLLIRPAVPDDAEAIARFNEAMAWETERKTLEPSVIRAGVRAVLQDPQKGRYFVACDQSAPDAPVIGQLMHTWEWSDWRNGQFWWLQSVYVDQRYRRRGVFRQLLERVLEQASADGGVVGVRLYVEHENQAAQSVYQTLGFVNSGYQVLERMTS